MPERPSTATNESDSEILKTPSIELREDQDSAPAGSRPVVHIDSVKVVDPSSTESPASPYGSETQFQGLIDLVNAKTEDTQESVVTLPDELLVTSEEGLSQEAKLAIEKTYRDFNSLMEQQKALQSNQSNMHMSLIERERTLDRKERAILEKTVELERELRESERVRHGYEKRLQVVAEREASLDGRQRGLASLIDSGVSERSVKFKEEFSHKEAELEKEFANRCREAELDFEQRHASLESRYNSKRQDLKLKLQERQQLVEHEIATKVEMIEKALIEKLELQKTQAVEELEYEKKQLAQQEASLRELFSGRLSELESREAEFNKFIIEIQHIDQKRLELENDKESLETARAELRDRSEHIKSSGAQFKSMLEGVRGERELLEQLKAELLRGEDSLSREAHHTRSHPQGYRAKAE